MNLQIANEACAKHGLFPLRPHVWLQYRTSKTVGRYQYDLTINEPHFGDVFHATLRILDRDKCKSVSHIARFETENDLDNFIAEALGVLLPKKAMPTRDDERNDATDWNALSEINSGRESVRIPMHTGGLSAEEYARALHHNQKEEAEV